MQGHGDHEVESLIEGDGAQEEGPKRFAKRFHASVFEQMDEVFESAFVVTV